ncbi:MAG TPA: sigma-54 dependent transcriptional regulator [Phycisphaerae bacterium]|nr:sigma-54 dependent transcriptional regulator [Phycisphaerae bacterium]
MAQPSVLIIEDEEGVRTALQKRLRLSDCSAEAAATGEAGLTRLGEAPADLVLLDYRLPDANGLELLEQIRNRWPDTLVIMMTAYTNVDVAIQAVRLGAYDYVSKPFSLDEMMVVVDKALETKHLRTEVERLQTTQVQEFSFDRVVARSPKMFEIVGLLKNLAASEARTILLQGESGTGKDLVAKVIHYNSPRADRPFMNITCTALPETLLESELFGHEKGAFTDAHERKQGLFELAEGGTIFLDEIGDMPPALQAKLLRFLEEKAFRRVGGTVDLVVDVRIVAATNKDLRRLVSDGVFREDLYYRLNVFPVTLPPLRERADDIPLLTEHFIRQYSDEFRKEVTGIDPAALAVMEAYYWPGNVREMRNLIERAMLLSGGGRLTLDSLPMELMTSQVVATGQGDDQAQPLVILGPQGVDIRQVERRLVQQAMDLAGGNQSRAAGLLRLSRDQLRYRLKKFGLLKNSNNYPAS